ncbi:MAG: DUF1501 domain-containing protein [Planctomycetota bacterium]
MTSSIHTRRRSFLSGLAGLGMGASVGGSFFPGLVSAAEQQARKNGRHCILLWMSGGPSQIDTFDLKPNHTNGGPFKESASSEAGLRLSEHLPKLAQQADRLAVLRGLSTKEGDHERGTTIMRTGHPKGGPVHYPAIGCSLSKALANAECKLPGYVSITPGPFAASSLRPGFLGPRYAATTVRAAASNPAAAVLNGLMGNDFADLRVEHLQSSVPVDSDRYRSRMQLWDSMQQSFLRSRPTANSITHDTVYRSAIEMLGSDAKDAFNLDQEPAAVREAYGKSAFGQGCLMARRLIERGVPIVEVTLGEGLGWDTHADNFERVKELSGSLDAGWSTLMTELSDRGLLERTTLLWAGEFGRTPTINASGGRDHFPQAFSAVLAGGGIAGGQAYGATSEDGMEVVDGKITQQDLLATLCRALGVDPSTENMAEGGRPIAIAEGEAIDAVLS